MKITKNDGILALIIENKDEAIELYSNLNDEYHRYAPENDYVLSEVEFLEFPLTIREDEVHEETYPYMWGDDFDEIVREFSSKIENMNNGDEIQI